VCAGATEGKTRLGGMHAERCGPVPKGSAVRRCGSERVLCGARAREYEFEGEKERETASERAREEKKINEYSPASVCRGCLYYYSTDKNPIASYSSIMAYSDGSSGSSRRRPRRRRIYTYNIPL